MAARDRFSKHRAARTALGAAEQSIADSNLQRQYELDLKKLGYSEEAARTAAQNKVAEEQLEEKHLVRLDRAFLKLLERTEEK